MSLISKKDLCQLLPHAGGMCLLDSVVDWNMTTIRCIACSHIDRQNPLRQPDGLASICGLEYAAQAIGVHIGLTTSSDHGPAIGYVGAVKALNLHSPRLDTFKEDLEIECQNLFGQGTSFIYSFVVKAGRAKLLEGRASIFVKLPQ